MVTITENDMKMLQDTLEHEYFGAAAYRAAIASGLLSSAAADVARTFGEHHQDHAAKLAELVRDAGGKPVDPDTDEAYFAEIGKQPLESEADILRYALSLEKGAAIGYLQLVSEFENRKLAQIMASISGDEAMHWAALRQALGMPPVPVSFVPLTDQGEN